RLAGHDRGAHAPGVGNGHREPSRVHLAHVRARPLRAGLAGHTISIGRALVATLPVDAAELSLGALAVVRTVRFLGQLADVEGAVARHAPLLRGRVGAVAARLTARVAALERAHERRVAIRVEAAALRERGFDRVVARARARGENGQAEEHAESE